MTLVILVLSKSYKDYIYLFIFIKRFFFSFLRK